MRIPYFLFILASFISSGHAWAQYVSPFVYENGSFRQKTDLEKRQEQNTSPLLPSTRYVKKSKYNIKSTMTENDLMRLDMRRLDDLVVKYSWFSDLYNSLSKEDEDKIMYIDFYQPEYQFKQDLLLSLGESIYTVSDYIAYADILSDYEKIISKWQSWDPAHKKFTDEVHILRAKSISGIDYFKRPNGWLTSLFADHEIYESDSVCHADWINYTNWVKATGDYSEFYFFSRKVNALNVTIDGWIKENAPRFPDYTALFKKGERMFPGNDPRFNEGLSKMKQTEFIELIKSVIAGEERMAAQRQKQQELDKLQSKADGLRDSVLQAEKAKMFGPKNKN